MGPDFLYLGCAKAGSGWLYEQLSDHPAFWLPPIKELHYLNTSLDGGEPRQLLLTAERQLAENRTAKRRRPDRSRRDRAFLQYLQSYRPERYDLEWYLSLFQWKKGRLSGDITPAHAALRGEAIARLVARLPQLRGLLFVRDPVERAWSHINMAIRLGARDGKGMAEVIGDPEHWPDVERFLTTNRSMLASSHPSRTYRAWAEHLPPERIFVGFFDDLLRDPAGLRAEVLTFLGADPAESRGRFDVGHNAKQKRAKLPLPAPIRAQLGRFFRRELEDCAGLFGGAARDWPGRYDLRAPAVATVGALLSRAAARLAPGPREERRGD